MVLDAKAAAELRDRAGAEQRRVRALATDMARQALREMCDEGVDPIAFVSDLMTLFGEREYRDGYEDGQDDAAGAAHGPQE